MKRSGVLAMGAVSVVSLVVGAVGSPILTQGSQITAPSVVTVPVTVPATLAPAAAPAPAPALALAAIPAADPNIFVSLARQTVPSVVNISAVSLEKAPTFRGGFRGPEDMFEEFFGGMGGMGRSGRPPGGGPGPGRRQGAGSLGTGFVVEFKDGKGIILTNQHVVANADEIRLTFTESPDEKPTIGKVVGRDAELDIALIEVKTDRKLQALPLGDSDATQVGEYVAAVGNPFGQGHSFTHGLISAKGRPSPGFPLATYLQTDAPINPGNSGGPLINLRGEVVGINNAIDARAQGIGFAIPINLVKAILPDLRTKGKIARGYMGAVISDMSPEMAEKLRTPKSVEAPLVVEVAPGGPAYRAGIRPYDLILEFNGKPVRKSADLISQVMALPEGKSVPVKVSRDDRTLEMNLRLSERPQTLQDS